jgi:uncharacterized protein (TIGR02145 family)
VSSDSNNGTIEYAVSHPLTFITRNTKNNDWYYTGSSSTDDTRWTSSNSAKSIYDPCPVGWRVPDGDSNGVWAKAVGSSLFFEDKSLYDSTNNGINFSGKFGTDAIIWYPVTGARFCNDGYIGGDFDCGFYWSASPDSHAAYYFCFTNSGYVSLSYNSSYRSYGQSVRCMKE